MSVLGNAAWPAQRRWRRTRFASVLVLGAFVGALGLAFALHLAGLGRITGGRVDVGFSQAMIVHHDQAVAIARIASTNTSPQQRNTAAAIINSQLVQIGQMRGWLEIWRQNTMPRDYAMAWMSPQGKGDQVLWEQFRSLCSPSRGMPGLASVEEMTALRQAKGRQADVLFLQLMIRHHQGGLPMLRYAALNAESYLVRSLAYSEQIEQTREIGWMTQQLASLGEKPLPFVLAERTTLGP